MSQCRWIGTGQGCTHKAEPGRSYCEEHLWRVYQKGTQLSKRRKDIQISTTVFFWEGLFNEAVEELEAEGWNFNTEHQEFC